MSAKTILRSVAFAVITVGVEALALEPDLEVQYGGPIAAMETPRTQPVLFRERISLAFDDRSEDVFADQLHAFNMVKWTLQLAPNESDDFRERTGSAARGAFWKSLNYSLRDAVVESPVMVWLQERQEFLASFLRDSIDSIEEESVSPLDGSYGRVERAWWKDVRQRGAVRYGIRPFRTSPYAFTSFAVKDRNEVFFMGHVRYYYDRFAEHRFEFALSVPVAYGFAIDLGTSYQFGRHADSRRAGIKLFKELKTGGIAHLGFELRERPVILAGITFPW